jgi:Zn-dependent protease
VARDRELVWLLSFCSGVATGLVALLCSVPWLKSSWRIADRHVLFVAAPVAALATAVLTAVWLGRALADPKNASSEPPADGAWDSATEQLFWETRSALAVVSQRSPPRFGLLTSAGLFALVGLMAGSLSRVLLFMLVILLHEAGHLLAMRLFGYRDTRVFFIPGFGGAATGIKEDAKPWQRAMVLLAGPVPGVLLGLGLLLVTGQVPALRYAAVLLVWLNAFNLLPLSILDGGKLMNDLVFSRHHLLEGAFMAVTSVGLVWFGLAGNTWILVAVGAFTLLLVAPRARIGRVAAAVRASGCPMPLKIERTDETGLRTLFRLAFPVAAAVAFPRPLAMASLVRSVHAEARVNPTPVVTTVVLLGVYASSIAVSLVAVLLTG